MTIQQLITIISFATLLNVGSILSTTSKSFDEGVVQEVADEQLITVDSGHNGNG